MVHNRCWLIFKNGIPRVLALMIEEVVLLGNLCLPRFIILPFPAKSAVEVKF